MVCYCKKKTLSTAGGRGASTHGGRVGYTWTVVDAAACSHTVDTVDDFNDTGAEVDLEKVPSHSEADRVQDIRVRLNADVPAVEGIYTGDLDL